MEKKKVDAVVAAARPFLRGDLSQVDPELPSLVSVLCDAGAGECYHKHGTFLAHLIDVYRILRLWGAPDAVARCGLYHSAYSNSYVNLAIFQPDVARDHVRGIIGAAAERLVHLFCVVPRHQLMHDDLHLRYTDAELTAHLAASQASLDAARKSGGGGGDPGEAWRAKLASVVPPEGVVARHIRTGEAVALSREGVGRLHRDDHRGLQRPVHGLPGQAVRQRGRAAEQYDAYIHWFYYFHRGPAPLASLADAASTCLEKENSMTLLWRTVKAFSYIQGSIVGECIVEWMRTVIKEKGEIEHPFGIDAAKCIAKEAELISEWLRHGRRMLTDDEYTLCHEIRAVACKLFVIRGEWTVDIASALLGIRKEAEWLIENLKRFPVESISTSMKIRQFALDFVWEKIGEYASYKNKESSESEMASESDADVTESNDNDYMVCYDEDYLKLGFGDPYSILTDTAEGDDVNMQLLGSLDLSFSGGQIHFYSVRLLLNSIQDVLALAMTLNHLTSQANYHQYNAYLHWFYYFHTSLAPLASLVDAASMGIRKEAEWLIENLKRNNVESISTSMKIRQFALDFLCEKYVEYGSFKKQESSESEMASESDEDVVEEHTYYVVLYPYKRNRWRNVVADMLAYRQRPPYVSDHVTEAIMVEDMILLQNY
ncbi:hypothetical protein OsJ_08972 [Oryza sativa Japonica Group]|uniref:DUF6817 domain-containing protein n=2 Tax=Oryza TaxID=4527 RepID=B9F4N1_ORYSJ|nr:hypothetical protein OsJ_08972 [Oryza sativa Japonica Group]